MVFKRRLSRVRSALVSRWLDEPTILILMFLAVVAAAAALGSRYEWGKTQVVLAGCVGTVALVGVAEWIYALTERRSASRWRTHVTHLHVLSPMDKRTRDHLSGWDWVHKTRPPGAFEVHPGEYDRRDPRVLRRWYDHGLPVDLLAAFLYAGLSDREIQSYLDASPGSSTRTEFEFLAALAVPADVF